MHGGWVHACIIGVMDVHICDGIDGCVDRCIDGIVT